MKKVKHRAWSTRSVMGAGVMLVLAAIMIATSITPVLADEYRRHHKWKKHHGPRGYYVAEPYYAPVPAPVYVAPPPPPVVYAPPPPPPGISLVFPIHIR